MKCKVCRERAVVALPSHHAGFCAEHFLQFFTRQVERAIRRAKLFTRDDKILVALSGGKDSLALMLELGRLEYDVTGLHVDLSIPNSSEHARRKVEGFCEKHGFPLHVVELEKEGMPIPRVKAVSKRPICSLCGKIKRYYFNKVALDHGFTALATGHNLDDEVSRLFANTLRWDAAYLADQGPLMEAEHGFSRKVKPLFRLTEFETANYAFLNNIDLHMAPCPYSKGASFSAHKELWAALEARSPGQKMSFYGKFLKEGRPFFAAQPEKCQAPIAPCERCGYPTSAGTCSVCRIRATL